MIWKFEIKEKEYFVNSKKVSKKTYNQMTKEADDQYKKEILNKKDEWYNSGILFDKDNNKKFTNNSFVEEDSEDCFGEMIEINLDLKSNEAIKNNSASILVSEIKRLSGSKATDFIKDVIDNIVEGSFNQGKIAAYENISLMMSDLIDKEDK